MTISKDTIYAKPIDSLSGFRFDESVAAVFPDMIERSVPGYQTIVAMSGVLAGKYAKKHTRLYDLGCSLGATSFALANHSQHLPASIIAIDNSAAMVKRLKDSLHSTPYHEQVTVLEQDILTAEINNASVITCNFTLQFIPGRQRDVLAEKIYKGLNPGGILILSEKICFEDTHLEKLNNDLHHRFKRNQGYSELEISQKRTALENVLTPETIACHKKRLTTAGFQTIDVWFQCFNFMSLVAIKK